MHNISADASKSVAENQLNPYHPLPSNYNINKNNNFWVQPFVAHTQ